MAQKAVVGGGEDRWGPVLRAVLRLVGGAIALLLVFALLSFHPADPQLFDAGALSGPTRNWCGIAGAAVAGLLHRFAGYGALVLPGWIAWECWPHRDMGAWRRWAGRLSWIGLAFAVWTLLGGLPAQHWALENGAAPLEVPLGGWMGRMLWPHLRAGLGPIGLPIVLLALVVLCVFVLAPTLSRAFAALMAKWMGEKALPFLKPLPFKGVRGALAMVRRPFLRWSGGDTPELAASDVRDLESEAARAAELESQREALIRAEMEAADLRRKGVIRDDSIFPPIQSMNLQTPSGALPEIRSMNLDEAGVPKEALGAKLLKVPAPKAKAPLVAPQSGRDRYGREFVQPGLPMSEPTPREPIPALPALPEPPKKLAAPEAPGDEALPPRRLFDPPGPHGRVDPAALEGIREVISAKLAEFKIKGAVAGIQPGPVVTVFEFQPDPGIPLSRILGMEEDLALALQAEKVRMDRIPGKNLVGIEVPNPKREVITFREVIDAPLFQDAPSLLSLAMGKDIEGKPVVADLAKMPHLLIGGSTGSGKSVGVNAMICSVLLRAKPEEAKLILVDPKMVEMGVYEGIPHLWAPVVTDMKEAGRVLKWVVAQMEDRYRRLSLINVKSLETYNQKVAEAGGRIDLSDRTPNPRWPERPRELDHLPFVVVVIDELADLMMVARSEVEDSIARIAQKARAVGIHLVLATQRPSVDVVTGVIKANLPARLSYRVNTKIDSRTILDSGGGEQLLGKGDALFLAPGTARARRIHAPFLTEEETLRLVDWLRARGKPSYNQGLIQAMEEEEEGSDEGLPGLAEGDGDIYGRAVAVVKRERKASTSLLQRKLNIGYGRAARLIDRMEEEGLVGPDRGAGKPREVLGDFDG
ncbi:MAG: DNA translocase FtsK 4TM domain-containing protein [Acidobacteria bacterium]|nr:DNA translocase FtsK 4TM domain-containing protein [Acidobacteriota bacterium]